MELCETFILKLHSLDILLSRDRHKLCKLNFSNSESNFIQKETVPVSVWWTEDVISEKRLQVMTKIL